MAKRLPVTVITGFLGAGKTTVITVTGRRLAMTIKGGSPGSHVWRLH